MVAGCASKRLIVISSPDADFCLAHQHILTVAGHVTEMASRLEDITMIASERMVDGVLLDGRTASAATLCEELKRGELTCRSKIVGLLGARAAAQYPAFLKAGIDVAFVRPVEPQRYLNAFRRLLGIGSREDRTACQFDVGGLEVDGDRHRVSWQGHAFHLGLIEFRILHLLLDAPGKVLAREQLIDGAWPSGIFVDPRTVNVHVARLRKILLSITGVDRIRTVRGVGYAIKTERSDEPKASRQSGEDHK
ncbi:MAG: winged helix-turn-helix transcriptional regulator [Ensifer adhaerens]